MPRKFFSYFFLFLAITVSAGADAIPDRVDVPEIIGKYVTALAAQQNSQKGSSSEVMFTANLPKLKKEGKMSLLRKVSRLGEITYKQLQFWGDETIKKEVIARFLTAETKAKEDADNLSVTPANYQFKYKGLQTRDERRVYIFEVKPRDKKVGVFKGELWIDPETYLPLREAGRMVKNPSIFFKKVDFVREYEIAGGVARTKHIDSVIYTRIAGKAELNIDYTNYQAQADTPVDAAHAQ